MGVCGPEASGRWAGVATRFPLIAITGDWLRHFLEVPTGVITMGCIGP